MGRTGYLVQGFLASALVAGVLSGCTSPVSPSVPVGVSSAGAFKVVNSWGTNWEHVAGKGHYWVTYEAMKALQMQVYYFTKATSGPYYPTAQVFFQMASSPAADAVPMDQCQITFSVTPPGGAELSKSFMAAEGSFITSGAGTALWSSTGLFPLEQLVFDVSEFAPYLNSADLMMKVTNLGTGATAPKALVSSASVQFYSPSSPVYTPLGTPIAIPASSFSEVSPGTSLSFAFPTQGVAPQASAVTAVARSAVGDGSYIAAAAKPSAAELAADKSRFGVSVPGTNYNRTSGGHGTGYAPPSETEWASMLKLQSVTARQVRSASGTAALVNTSVDHTKDPWFPPVGDQGGQGSCTCFSVVYYANTYTAAKDFGHDLTSVTWAGDTWATLTSTAQATSVTSAGAPSPSSSWTTIMSPAFIYNQINGGGDNGASVPAALGLVQTMGTASWNTMPWSYHDSKTFPSTAAFQEASQYRSGDVSGDYVCNYFVVQTDNDLANLAALIASGVCVVTVISVSADNQLTSPDSFFSYLNNQDVVSTTNFSSSLLSATLDHAQTIVGFKDGTAWNPNQPDL